MIFCIDQIILNFNCDL